VTDTYEKHRSRCCLNGQALHANLFPHIGMLSEKIASQTYDNIDHFTSKSSYYNGCLSLSAISVENGKGGGWERINGDSSVTLNGRTHHFLPSTGGNGGIEYFTFDAEASLSQYGSSLNGSQRYGDNVNDRIIRQIYQELKGVNPLIQECEIIGRFSSTFQENVDRDNHIEDHGNNESGNSRTLISTINQRTSHFDIAAITSISRTGNRIIKYQLKNCQSASKIPMDHSLFEPLSYPMFFPFGSGGWGSEWREIPFSKYLCCRMLMPDAFDDYGDEFRPKYLLNKMGTRQIPVNRFQCQARLGQMYLTGEASRRHLSINLFDRYGIQKH
jgi:hypothetical protein